DLAPRRFAHFVHTYYDWYAFFTPDSVTVSQGTTVRWAQDGDSEHSIGPVDGATSGTLSGWGDMFEHTFTTVGVHDWRCADHDREVFTIVVESRDGRRA